MIKLSKFFQACICTILFVQIFSNSSHAVEYKKVIPVTVTQINNIVIFPVNDVPATAISENTSTLSAEIKGLIKDIPTKIGDKVQKEDVLLEINCDDYILNLERTIAQQKATQADAKFTKWLLLRSEKLAKSNNASQEQVHQYQSKLKHLEAMTISQEQDIKNAKNNIQRCKIMAPFYGVVTEKHVSLGEYAIPGSKLITIVDSNNLEVEATMHFSEILEMKAASKHTFTANDVEYDIKVRAIVQNQDTSSRTQTVRMVFTDQKPLPGTAGRLSWKIDTPSVPAEYIRQVKNKLGIFVVKNNKAEFVELPDAVEGQPVPLTKNIQHPIIQDGRYAVTVGSEVEIIK